MDEYAVYGVILALSKEVDHETLPEGLRKFLDEFESGINEIVDLREAINEAYVSEVLESTNHSTTIH